MSKPIEIRRSTAICPILTAAAIAADGGLKGRIITAQVDPLRPKESQMPAAACVKEACALFVPTMLSPDGNVLGGSCGLALIAPALVAVENVISQALAASARPETSVSEATQSAGKA